MSFITQQSFSRKVRWLAPLASERHLVLSWITLCLFPMAFFSVIWGNFSTVAHGVRPPQRGNAAGPKDSLPFHGWARKGQVWKEEGLAFGLELAVSTGRATGNDDRTSYVSVLTRHKSSNPWHCTEPLSTKSSQLRLTGGMENSSPRGEKERWTWSAALYEKVRHCHHVFPPAGGETPDLLSWERWGQLGEIAKCSPYKHSLIFRTMVRNNDWESRAWCCIPVTPTVRTQRQEDLQDLQSEQPRWEAPGEQHPRTTSGLHLNMCTCIPPNMYANMCTHKDKKEIMLNQ